MPITDLFAWLYWNPPREVFTIPFIDRPIAWYGVLFVLGFGLGYFIVLPILTRFLYQSNTLSTLDILNWPGLINALRSKKSDQTPLVKQLNQFDPSLKAKIDPIKENESIDEATKQRILDHLNHFLKDNQKQRKELEDAFPDLIATARHTSYFLADRLCWFLIVGTLIGARLGVVFFYDWPYYQSQPLEIFKIWKGGLASHGGALGIALALYFYVLYIRKWVPSATFLKLLDAVSIPAALGAGCIRLGNFVNQEILGTPTQMPWGVIFGDPADGSTPVPRHPIQLYEAAAYFLTFIFLYWLWRKKGDQLRTGILSGLLLIFVFLSRFILEFWKSNQESFVDISFFQMGQFLSLPFILLGVLFIFYPKKNQSLKIF
jgi:phosphatidylglycerol:prolipoprotein diacylglycerol transferase